MTKMIEIAAPFNYLREVLKNGFELEKLKEKRIRASEEHLDRIVDQYGKTDPDMVKKLMTNINTRESPYCYLFNPSLKSNRNLWQVIKDQVRDPDCYCYLCENDEGKLIGCCGYYIEKDKPTDIFLFSWEGGITKFDAFTMMNNLVEKYDEIHWDCVKGNPAETIYDDYIRNKKLNGYEVGKIYKERDDRDPVYKEPYYDYFVRKRG